MESVREVCWPGWEVVRPLGSGGFGRVYEIRKGDETGEYRAALKVLQIPGSPSEYEVYEDDGYDEESITSIFKSQMEDVAREFALMAQFKGVSNIVSYEEHMIVPHEDGRGWDILIRMELLTSLPQYCREHKMTEEDVLQLGMDICRGLELCGRRKVIHRDIKPQNLFINDFGDFKLGDFGIAKTLNHTTKATRTGTSAYMAPEVYNNQPYGTTVDVYSLGLVLYWLLNERRLPFLPMNRVPTHGEMEAAAGRRYKGESFPPPKNGSKALKAVVMKACAYAPEDRYATPGEMREALAAVRYGRRQPVEFAPEEPEEAPEPIVSEAPEPVAQEASVQEPVIYEEIPEEDDERTVGGVFYRPPVIKPEPKPEPKPESKPVPEPEPFRKIRAQEEEEEGKRKSCQVPVQPEEETRWERFKKKPFLWLLVILVFLGAVGIGCAITINSVFGILAFVGVCAFAMLLSELGLE